MDQDEVQGQVTIDIPSLWQKVGSCYRSEYEEAPRVILAPLDVGGEALFLQMVSLIQLKDMKMEVLVVVDNVNEVQFGSQLQPRERGEVLQVSDLISLLEWRGHTVNLVQLDPRARPEQVVVPLSEWMNQNNKRMVLFLCNLAKMNNTQRAIEEDEKVLIPLCEVDLVPLEKVLLEGRKLKESSSILLLTLVRLVSLQNWRQGRVVCYSDNRGWRREGWIDSLGPETIGYVSMCWGTRSAAEDMKPIFSYDRLQLVALARSVVAATILEAPTPSLPRWSPWYTRENGIFVGVSDGQGPMASVGYYQDPEGTRDLPSNLVEAARLCPRDAKGRWKRPITSALVWNLHYDVKVLQPYQQWIHLNSYELPSLQLTPEDGWGVRLELAGGLSATYLPSVWRERPYWTIEEFLTNLSIKAGGTGREWMNEESRASLYSVVELVECPSPEK